MTGPNQNNSVFRQKWTGIKHMYIYWEKGDTIIYIKHYYLHEKETIYT